MPNFSFVLLEGTIQNIRPFGDECCSSLVTLQTSEGTVTVVVSSDTYVISEVRLRRGMTVAAFTMPRFLFHLSILLSTVLSSLGGSSQMKRSP